MARNPEVGSFVNSAVTHPVNLCVGIMTLSFFQISHLAFYYSCYNDKEGLLNPNSKNYTNSKCYKLQPNDWTWWSGHSPCDCLNPAVTILENFIKFPHRTIRNLLANGWTLTSSKRLVNKWLTGKVHRLESTVADPGFSRGGAPTPKLGLFCKFFAENCMKIQEFGPRGALDPPMQ